MSKYEYKFEYSTVFIPKPLTEKIKDKMKGIGFAFVFNHGIYILSQIISSIEEEECSKQAFSKKRGRKDQTKIKRFRI
ncbi:MAG: CopG family transcriptional regulator [Candidatus Helarchaeota archaeon]